MKHVQADDNDLLDLVDKDDSIIGTINQADARNLLETKAGFIRGTVAFIKNDEGKLWIPRRTADKRIAPNGLDFSVAEHVQSGETYEQAIIRGFKEELFLDVNSDNIKFLGKLEPIPHIPYFFTSVFLYNANKVKEYNHADFIGFEWLEPQEVIRRIDNGVPSKNALKSAILTFL
jgi:isopentenyldiphosphate isomerase